jgi:hypothetical protein
MTTKDILDSTFVVDDAAITQQLRSGRVSRIAWDDLIEIAVETTPWGPFYEDVYFHLVGRDNAYCVVPQASPIISQLVEKLLHLPGFNSEAFIRAMASTDNATFVCWQRKQPEQGNLPSSLTSDTTTPSRRTSQPL